MAQYDESCISMPPIVNKHSKVIILGSMPGEISLEKQQYYGNPRNHFWPIIFQLMNTPLEYDYDKRTEFLLSKGLALWDVIACCTRKGSLDANIKSAEKNDFVRFFEDHPQIECVILNGRKADQVLTQTYRKTLPPHLTFICMPSTSPVPGKNVLTYDQKLEKWAELLKYV